MYRPTRETSCDLSIFTWNKPQNGDLTGVWIELDAMRYTMTMIDLIGIVWMMQAWLQPLNHHSKTLGHGMQLDQTNHRKIVC